MTATYRPVSCPVCRRDGSPTGQAYWEGDTPPNCRWHPKVQMEPPPKKSEKENNTK